MVVGGKVSVLSGETSNRVSERRGHVWLPQLPLVLCDDVDAEEQIRDGVSGDAIPYVFGADH